MDQTEQQLQDAKDLFIVDVTPAAPAGNNSATTAGGNLGPRVPAGKKVSRTKIIFDDSSEDEEEREKRWASALPAQGDAGVAPATTMNLSTDVNDYEDPLEMAKLKGLDSDLEDGLEAPQDGDASSDLDSNDFFEDIKPKGRAAGITTTAAAAPPAIKGRTVEIPDSMLMMAPGNKSTVPGLTLGAAQVRNYVKRTHRPGEPVVGEGDRQKRDRDDEVGENAEQDAGGAAEGDADDEDEEEEKELKRWEEPVDPTLIKTVFGYNLSIDPRDLEENPGREVRVGDRILSRRTKRVRDDDANIVVDPALLPSDDEKGGENGTGGTGTGGGDDYDAYEDEEEEIDSEDEALEEEIDDLALVASIERLVAGCDQSADPEDPRYKEFKAMAKNQQEKLWCKEISVHEFAVAMLPAVAQIRGAVKQALRPPKPGNMVIDGVQMDI